jgi:hypothetical protein
MVVMPMMMAMMHGSLGGGSRERDDGDEGGETEKQLAHGVLNIRVGAAKGPPWKNSAPGFGRGRVIGRTKHEGSISPAAVAGMPRLSSVPSIRSAV